MTDEQTPATPSIPAGWYQDPSNASLKRWWDGTQWTEQVSAPYVQGEQQRAPEGTEVQTPWIWLNVLLPVLGLIPLFFMDFSSLFRQALEDPTGMSSLQGQLAFYTSPAAIVSTVLGWLLVGVTILFAYLDWRELKRRGVPAPFHWAFAFLGLAGFGVVYPIGRSVVVKRRTGRSDHVLLAAILQIVVTVVVVIVFVVVIFNQIFATIAQDPGLFR
jgi:hypothetical protein